MFRLDIIQADWCLGMGGSITFRPLPNGRQYTVRHNMHDGLQLDGKKCQETDILSLLDERWDWRSFEIAWQAYSEGFEKGKHQC